MRLALCSLVMLAACTSHEVRCDAHLRPINLPAPAKVPGAGANPTTPPAAAAPPLGTPTAGASPGPPPPEGR
jgi:hypothetical protein